jgi:myosin-1
MFDTKGVPVGAQITNYLLEKGRVVGQIKNERDFHIFYQFTKAASPEMRGPFPPSSPSCSSLLCARVCSLPVGGWVPFRLIENFGIQGPESYVYTSKSGCLDVASIDDKEDFAETLKAMVLWYVVLPSFSWLSSLGAEIGGVWSGSETFSSPRTRMATR